MRNTQETNKESRFLVMDVIVVKGVVVQNWKQTQEWKQQEMEVEGSRISKESEIKRQRNTSLPLSGDSGELVCSQPVPERDAYWLIIMQTHRGLFGSDYPGRW